MMMITKNRRIIAMMENRIWLRVPMKVLRDQELTVLDVGVFAVIADKADGETCTMSFKDIQEELQCSKSSVLRAVAKLERKRYIAVQRMQGSVSTYRQLLLEPKRKGGRKAAKTADTFDVSKYEIFINADLEEVSKK